MTPLKALQAARARIATSWTTGAFARYPNGYACSSEDPQAVRWCAAGALTLACRFEAGAWEKARGYLDRVIKPGQLVTYNDTHSHAEVLAAFDKAIELAKAKETAP